MVVGYNFPIWSKMMSFDFQWDANENYETQLYASRLFHEPRKHCLRNSNSYQLPTTISHLLVSNKNTKNSPTMKSASVSTKNVTPAWEKNSAHMRQLRLMRQVDFCPWAKWAARDQQSPALGRTVMGIKIIKIGGKRLVNGWSSFELAIYHGF